MAKKDDEMNEARFVVTYDGELLSGHKMDVRDLAPAMLALGDLVREANNEINGGNSKVSLLVNSDFEKGCFIISFELVQSILEQIVTFIEDDNIKTAKDILEWVGIIGGPIGGLSLLAYLKFRKGRPIQDVIEIKDQKKTGYVSVKFEGDDNHVVVHQNIFNLGESPSAKRAASQLVGPLLIKGIDSLQTTAEGDEGVRIEKEAAQEIQASCDHTEEEIVHEPQEVIAHLRLYSPVFDQKAKMWRFEYGQEHIYADISETTIFQDVEARGEVSVGETYKVRMSITEHETKTGRFRNEYKILEVLEFFPASKQTDFFAKPKPENGENEEP